MVGHGGISKNYTKESIQNLCEAWIPLELETISNNDTNIKEFRELVEKATMGSKLTGIVHNNSD